ncbi:MAG TPA: CheR family methyltransferase [Candidatus Binatia bacterium]|jgi:chemotaxis protein methyltransferase CheR|nr:CheR family methyltransferase [Candidatus Binatia bacterium]
MEEQQELSGSAAITERGWSSAHMERNDLLRLRDLMEEKTGLYLPAEKLHRLEDIFAYPAGILRSIPAEQVIYALTVNSKEGAGYLNSLVEALTTNETYFFRTLPHFDVLRNYLLPEVMQAKRSQGKKTLKIWSAACSTGEEPYSVAILLLDNFPDLHDWDTTILATDIDLDALERAQAGIYRPWSFRGVGPDIVKKYFCPMTGESYRVDDRVRSLVTFRALNLKGDTYPSLLSRTTAIDIIFCRNVIIYFRQETNQKIIRGLYNCLNEGGFLLTGAVEHSHEIYKDFEARVFPQTVIYQKPHCKKPNPKVAPTRLPLPPAREFPRRAPEQARRDEDPSEKTKGDAVDEALDLISKGEVDRALVLLAGEAERNREDARVFFLLGQISADRHHLSEASHWLLRTLTLNPLHLWAHYFLGLIWIEEDKRDAALQSFKKAIYIDPNFALGYFYLGKIYKDQGQIEKARKSLAVTKRLLSSTPLSGTLPGANGITAQELLTLVDRELSHEG